MTTSAVMALPYLNLSLQGIDSAKGPEKEQLIYGTSFRPVSAEREAAMLSSSAQHAQRDHQSPKQAMMVISAAQPQPQMQGGAGGGGGGTGGGWGPGQANGFTVKSSSAWSSFLGRPCCPVAVPRHGMRGLKRGVSGYIPYRGPFNSLHSNCAVLL